MEEGKDEKERHIMCAEASTLIKIFAQPENHKEKLHMGPSACRKVRSKTCIAVLPPLEVTTRLSTESFDQGQCHLKAKA